MNSYYGGAEAMPASGMLSQLVMIIPAVVILILLVMLWHAVAKNFARIAADKGYTEKKWFHYCFWLGLVGILMVCAMPDKNRR